MTQQLLCALDDAAIRSIKEIYEQGLTVDALRRAEQYGPLSTWQGARECVLGARIAANAGAPRLSARLTVRARRSDPRNRAALTQYGYEVLHRRGPLALWMLLRREQDEAPREESSGDLGELLALKSRAASDLRDFSLADSLLTRAETLAPGHPWIRLQRANLLRHEDRVEAALDAARSAFELHPHPFYRPAVQVCAGLLQELDRDDDAIQLLSEACDALQSASVAAQLYSLLSENGRWPEAEQALERCNTLSPLKESAWSNWLIGQRARMKYHLGRRAEAMAFASQLNDSFNKAFSDRLSRPAPETERIQLDVSFVRQHFKTCAPATLAAIGQYWSMPSEHIRLAEAMCYDGTPHWQQRQWAESNGWNVIEFRVTYEGAQELIENRIPFAISTVEATSAHMMAVIGFDRTRGTLLLRDPSQPYILEFEAEDFFHRYRGFGPRGTVFVPAGERTRLSGLALLESEHYDEYHAFWVALSGNDRAAASEIVARMASRFDEHPLVWEARLELATYDANNTEQIRCLDKLLESFPNSAARLLRRLACLRDASRAERIAFLRQVCAGNAADPALFIELARALQDDARCLPEAERLLKRTQRLRPMDSSGIGVLGDLLWQRQDLQQATDLYRFAANLESLREELYRMWFVACRQTRRTDEAIAYLEDRFARFGERSEQPALTLAWAWCEMEQPGRAREVLSRAALLRPDAGVLQLRAARLASSLLDFDDAARLLASAKGRVKEADWLRAALDIASARLDTAAVLGWAREILSLEPLALDAHDAAAHALAQLKGQEASLSHLKDAASRFPHHYGLKRIVVEWSRQAGPEAVEAAACELLNIDPSDAWARRELSLALVELNRGKEALKEAEESARIEPLSSTSWSVLACVCEHLQETDNARAHSRRAIELRVDNTDSLHRLISLARTDAERREEFAFIERELIRQVVSGDGLLTFVQLARPYLDPETLLHRLHEAHRQRPDLWHTWAALTTQLGHLERLDEALQIARQASELFPHLPGIWLNLSIVHQWRNEADREISAVERAFEINPGWIEAVVALAGALERNGRLDEARRIYERALQHTAGSAQLQAYYAHLLWRQRSTDIAMQAMERALRLAPAYEWAWGQLETWSSELGDGERVQRLAQSLAEERPGDPRVWITLAGIMKSADKISEGLTSVERALELNKHSTEAWNLKAELLALNEQFEEAIRACHDAALLCPVDTYLLRARNAWIEAQRGRVPEAIQLMRGVLAENSGYVMGWTQLAVWLSEQEDLAEAAVAFEQLRRLRPHDAWVSAQLGLLWLKQGDRAAAHDAFAAALLSEPSDVTAAHSLLDLQLENGDLAGASRTLEVMQLHQPGAHTEAAEIPLLLGRKETTAALKSLERLADSVDPAPWPLDRAAQAFVTAGLGGPAVKVLKRALRAGSANPQTGAAAIRILNAGRRHLAATWLFWSLEAGELQRRAASPVIEGLAGSTGTYYRMACGLALQWLLWRRKDTFRRDDAAWGQAGYALITFNQMRKCARWLADWRTRRDVQPWMLFNLCLALRAATRYTEANEVARHVLNVMPHRESAGDLHLFIAVEEALAGSLDIAETSMSQAIVRQGVAYDSNLLQLAKAVVEFRQHPDLEFNERFRKARRQLATQFPRLSLLLAGRDVRRTFRRAGDVFAREDSGWSARLWLMWKLSWHWPLVLIWLLWILV